MVNQFLMPDTLIYYRLLIVESTPGNFASELLFNYSFDGGKTVTSNQFPGLWNDITPPSAFLPDKFIHDSYFFNGHAGFLVGSDGNIIKTTDTGQNWESINSGVVEQLWDIKFINDKIGFVVGDFGRILKTEDGGETWRKTDSGTQENIYSIAFKNEHDGWVGTENGLRYTTDQGETWQGVPLRYIHGLIMNVEFDKSGNGYAYTPAPMGPLTLEGIDEFIPGGYNLLLVNKNEDIAVYDDIAKDISPKTIQLKPNYPNPFNSNTTINYYLPASGSVSLRIYNVQGKLVRTIVDKTQQAGEFSVSWDGLSDRGDFVASGIYFYMLRQGKNVRACKMLFLM